MITDDMRVLSVDDNETNLLIIETFCNKLNIKAESFLHPAKALEKFKTDKFDLVITDYMMPDINGIELISEIRNIDETIPIIMITAIGDDPQLHLDALESGATEFLTKPINPGIFKARLTNLLRLKKAMTIIEDKALLLEDEVRKATIKLIERESETLRLLGKTAEYKDPETGAHVSRVANYSKLMAEAYGLDKKMQDIIYNASPFHDIGKVGIPDSILLKPGPLTDAEFDTMKEHATIGYNILRNSKSEYLKAGGVIAFTHHEKYDGTGYPKGLKGEMIPVMGRIVAIADVFDALTSKRPYKEAWSFEKTFEYMKSCSGTHFDPKLIEHFVKKVDNIKNIYNTF